MYLDYLLTAVQGMLRHTSGSVIPILQYMQDGHYTQEKAATLLRGQNHKAQSGLREMAAALSDLNNSLVFQLGHCILGRRDMLLQNMKNGSSDDTFTEMRHSTKSTDFTLPPALIKKAKSEIENKQENSYSAHAMNWTTSQLASAIKIAMRQPAHTPAKQGPKRKWENTPTPQSPAQPKRQKTESAPKPFNSKAKAKKKNAHKKKQDR